MKRITALALALVLLLGLCACGNKQPQASSQPPVNEPGAGTSQTSAIPDDVQNTEDDQSSEAPVDEQNTNENKMDTPTSNEIDTSDEPEEPEESEEPESEITEVNFSEQITTDFVEIVIDGASSGDEIRPDNPESVYRYMPDQDDEKYVYLYGTIKNVGGESFEFADNMFAELVFDDKYVYSGNITADEGGDFSYIYAYLNPLKSEKFYIIASIPDELEEQYSKVVVKFGFCENFDGPFSIQEDECDYLYSVTVTRDA